jgi:hypothetical protein
VQASNQRTVPSCFQTFGNGRSPPTRTCARRRGDCTMQETGRSLISASILVISRLGVRQRPHVIAFDLKRTAVHSACVLCSVVYSFLLVSFSKEITFESSIRLYVHSLDGILAPAPSPNDTTTPSFETPTLCARSQHLSPTHHPLVLDAPLHGAFGGFFSHHHIRSHGGLGRSDCIISLCSNISPKPSTDSFFFVITLGFHN